MSRIAILTLAVIPLLAGCDKPDAKSRGTATTTVRDATYSESSSAASPSTAPASRPTTSVLMINNQEVQFPRARLVEQEKGQGVTLLLFSDDPPEAVHPNYKGNRYYLELEIDIEDVSQLPNAAWTYRAPSLEREDSPVGVFLEGDRKQLQPYDVSMVFDGRLPNVVITVAGQFTLFEREGAPPQTVWVRGMIPAELEKAKKR